MEEKCRDFDFSLLSSSFKLNIYINSLKPFNKWFSGFFLLGVQQKNDLFDRTVWRTVLDSHRMGKSLGDISTIIGSNSFYKYKLFRAPRKISPREAAGPDHIPGWSLCCVSDASIFSLSLLFVDLVVPHKPIHKLSTHCAPVCQDW